MRGRSRRLAVALVVATAALTVAATAACRAHPAPSGSPPATPPASASRSAPATPGPVPTTSPPVPPPSPSTATPPFPASLKGQDLTRIPTTNKVVALTFDAGANADAVASILATLKAQGLTATFFLTGDFVNEFPAAAKSIAAAGHRFGNHTMTHPHLTQLSDAQVRAQITDAENRIRAVTGNPAQPFFRFPYGDRTAHTIALVNAEGYVAVRWTVDSLGWQGTSQHTAAWVAQRVLDAAQPGAIVLMHVGSNPDDHSTLDADALPSIIDGYRAKGYSFVTLAALL
jgi:peptidoglycan/xylan/chitin deacetylase (PgdA/CDA1 family)